MLILWDNFARKRLSSVFLRARSQLNDSSIMKSTIYALIVAITALLGICRAEAASGDLFPYPTPPDTLMALQPRCDYLVSRFWGRCNFDQAMRNPAKFNVAFGDWIAIAQHASADTVHAAVDRLLASFAKKGPETLVLATMAENWLYSDTCSIFSEELYLPFARAAANHKKISRAEKARFQLHQKQIETSGLGATIPNLTFIRPDGTTGHFDEVNRGSVLVFINDPDCEDCNLARVRLGADFNANELISRGELSIISIYPDEPTDEWRAEAARYPENWTVCAIPDADTLFDLRRSPTFLFLNSRHKVLVKDIDLDYLLGAFRVTNTATRR